MKTRLFILSFIFCAALSAGAQNVGIGNVNPVHSTLEISGSVGRTVALFGGDRYGVGVGMNPPFIGFNYFYNTDHQVVKSGYASLIYMDTTNGDIHFGNFNNNVAGDFGVIGGYQTRMLVKQNGMVGMGTTQPAFPLTVNSGNITPGIIQESPDGTGRVGFYASSVGGGSGVVTVGNLALNFATGNGVSKMVLRPNGDLFVSESMNLNEKLTANPSGASNLLPVAMGKVSALGSILSATPGVFVTKEFTGEYALSFSFEPNLYANRSNYQLQLSTEGNTTAFTINYAFRSDNKIYIKTWKPYIGYVDVACSCGGSTPSVVTLSAQAATDCVFSFILRKF